MQGASGPWLVSKLLPALVQATVRIARGGDVMAAPAHLLQPLRKNTFLLPQTINALNLEISELKTELKDLDFTSDDYSDTQFGFLSYENLSKD